MKGDIVHEQPKSESLQIVLFSLEFKARIQVKE